MKIYVVGTGGVGGYFGGLMARGGMDVTFIARGEHYQAIRKNGLEVRTLNGNFVIKPAQVIENITDIQNADFIIMTVKTYDLNTVSQELVKVVSDKTTIISIQNGIDNDEVIKKYLPHNKVYPGTAYVFSSIISPGVIAQTGGLCKIVFGDRQNPHNTELEKLAQLLRDIGIKAECSTDVTRDLWNKFIFIVATSSMTAVTRNTLGSILADNETRKLYESLVQEAISVAHELRVNLSTSIFDDVMKLAAQTDPRSKSSLSLDIENHRKTELSTLVGKIVELGKKMDIQVPNSEKVLLEIQQGIRNEHKH